jgi:hypothetical protein
MMLALYTIGFGRPELLYHQKRLLDKYMDDEYGLCLIDNTPGLMRNKMEKVCRDEGIGYLHSPGPKYEHDDGLNYGAEDAAAKGHDFFGFLDADVFPCKHTTVLDKLQHPGFYGLPQTHMATKARYLWPGLCFFSKEWVNGRRLNFTGIRAVDKRDDGDCGSAMYSLFSGQDWFDAPLISFGYGSIREPTKTDEFIQSWGYELIGDWFHMLNSSHWLKVPDAKGRDRLLMEMVECL